MEHLVLIDGHHLMYRAYWAIPRTMSTKSGEQNNAVFGFASMILTILKKEEPDFMVICFDAGEVTFRHQQNDTYKDGRAETPDEESERGRGFALRDARRLLHPAPAHQPVCGRVRVSAVLQSQLRGG